MGYKALGFSRATRCGGDIVTAVVPCVRPCVRAWTL